MSVTPPLLAVLAAAPTALRAVDTLVEEAGVRFSDIFAGSTSPSSTNASDSPEIHDSWQKRLEDWINRLNRVIDQNGFSDSAAGLELSREGNISVDSSSIEFEEFLLTFFENNPELEDELRQIQQIRGEEQRLPSDHFISIESLQFEIE